MARSPSQLQPLLPTDNSTITLFSELLQATIDAASLRLCRKVHALLLKFPASSSDRFLCNRLVDAYSRCGSLRDARQVFDGIRRPNAFSWNAIIAALVRSSSLDEAEAMFLGMPLPDQCSWNAMVSAFAQHGRFEKSLRFFTTMHREDFVLNCYSFSSALSACAGLDNLRAGVQIHGLISKSPLADDVYMGGALVDMYSKCRHPLEARRVFDDMPERNVVCWNSLITCYEQNGPVEEALLLFMRMMECGSEPDEKTMASVVSACAGLSAFWEGTQVHARVVKVGRFRDDLVVGNALVDMYAKCGRIREARMVFDCMPVRCMVSETSILSGYARLAMVKDARSMFSGRTEMNIIAWNALIAGYTQSGEDEEALSLFLQLKRVPLQPTHYTFGNVLNACANLADLELGKQAHGHVLKHGFRFEVGLESDIFVGNSLVDMYLKCGSIDDGSSVFERMYGRDRVSWNAMIVGYAQNGRAEEALHLFRRMLKSGEVPDNVTMIGVLSGCSHVGMVEEGRQYFKSMSEEYGLVPSQDHYTCMVDLLGRAGYLEEVRKFIEEMPIAPDSVLWGSLLASCRVHGNMEMGEWAAGRLMELDLESSGTYVLLSNMYADTGRWTDVRRMRKLMKQRGVIKQPGCSWIEIERKVHVFMVKDKIHQRRKEIYEILKGLRVQMEIPGLDITADLLQDGDLSYACSF